MTIQGPFFVVDLLLGSRGILQDVFGIGKEDLSPPEGHEGEEEEDGPGDADEDDHDGVPDDEPRQIEDIRQDPDDGDETHIWKPSQPRLQIVSMSMNTKNGSTGEPPKRTEIEHKKEETYVSAQQPRISLRCLWSLNQYGRIPNMNKKTARPNSITPDITLTAYQTSPAVSDTRPWIGKLRGGKA